MDIIGENMSDGREAFGRSGRPPPHELNKKNYVAWTDDSIVNLGGRLFLTRNSEARRGQRMQDQGKAPHWAHPAAMAAVLTYARTAFRNGFRDEARRALEPYIALALLRADDVARCDVEVRMVLASMVSLHDRLSFDVDYYNNPPGWVPRLNALSNLAVLKSVREAAYGTYYFSDRLLRDAEALQDLRETTVLAQEALAQEMQAAKSKIGRAFELLPRAKTRLDEAQKRVLAVEGEVVHLRKAAIARSADQVVLQRFVSAALQLVDGVAKAVPIGQPFLGVAGSLFGAGAKIDWTAEKPLETANAAVAHLGEQVDTFVTEQADAVAKAVTGKRRTEATAAVDLVTKLTQEQEAATKAPEEAAAQVELSWRDFKSEELKRLDARIQSTREAIDKAKTQDTGDSEAEGQTASGFLEALKKQRELMNPKQSVAAQVSPLQKELVEYRKRQFELINAAEKVARLKRAELKALADKPKHLLPPSVEQKLVAATQQSEHQKKLLESAETTAKETMSQLEGLGKGLSMVGNAIISMATPVSNDDPTVQRLADEMLVNDPVLRAEGQRLTAKLKVLLEQKRAAVGELLRLQQEAATSLATVTRNLATIAALSRRRQSLDLGLNPAAKAYLKETRDAAKDALAESVYWFVKSYQYEFLKDVPDTFFNFDTWAAELHKLEEAKLRQAAGPAEPSAAPGTVATRARASLLSKEDFERIGDAVFKAEQFKLGKGMLEERQKRRPGAVGKYMNCELQRTASPADDRARRQNELLDALERGDAVFDFVRDFDKGTYDWNDARVAQVELVRIDIESTDPNLTLTLRVEQRGQMVLTRKVGSERHRFVFRTGRDDDPVGWTFVYNHWNRKTNSGLTTPTATNALEDTVKGLISQDLKLEDYQPALFSDYALRITDLFGAGGERKALTRIRGLNMTVHLSGG